MPSAFDCASTPEMIGLEEVAGREVADQRDLDAGLVEGRRLVRGQRRDLHQHGCAGQSERHLPQKSSCDVHLVFLHSC